MTKKKHEEVKEEEIEAVEKAEAAPQEDYYEQLIRLKADFENYRKRMERERPMLVELGREKVIEKFLPLYDVMLKARGEINKEKADVNTLKSGLEMVFKELEKIFDSEGIKVMQCVGKACNYDEHEVLVSIPANKELDGKIIEEVQKGFTLNGRVLRHAKVCVGKCEEAEEQSKEATQSDIEEQEK